MNKTKRNLVSLALSFLFISATALGPIARAEGPTGAIFENPTIRRLLTETKAFDIVRSFFEAEGSRFRGIGKDDLYERFIEEIQQSQNATFRDRLTERLTRIEGEWSELERANRGALVPTNTAERFFEQESKKLLGQFDRQTLSFKADRDFLPVEKDAIDAGQATDIRARATARLESLEEARVGLERSVSAMPAAPETPIDLKASKLTFVGRAKNRMRAYGQFFGFWRENWKSLFKVKGHTFSTTDLMGFRAINWELGGINDYSQLRLLIESATEIERPADLALINASSAEKTQQYLQGSITLKDYVAARTAAAKEIGVTQLWADMESAILKTLQRCRDLGGGMDRSGRIEGKIFQYEQSVQNLTQELSTLPAQIENANTPSKKRLLKAKLVNRRTTLDKQARALEAAYLEFTQQYEKMGLFQNLNAGFIRDGQYITPFEMPVSFRASPEDVQVWRDVYNRAFSQSTYRLVIKDFRAFVRARTFGTQMMVRNFNRAATQIAEIAEGRPGVLGRFWKNIKSGNLNVGNWFTGQYDGVNFTDTQAGRQFLSYVSLASISTIENAAAVLAGMGIPLSGGLAAWKNADKVKEFVSQLIDSVFAWSENSNTEKGLRTDSTAVDSSNTDSTASDTTTADDSTDWGGDDLTDDSTESDTSTSP